MNNPFWHILQQHTLRYPLMTPCDYGKLAYQSEFGPGHMISDQSAALSRLLEEWEGVLAEEYGGQAFAKESAAGLPRPSEPIGGGLCRFHLCGSHLPAQAAPLLTELFCRTAREHTGSTQGLTRRLALLRRLERPDMAGWLSSYEGQGCPPVHHSQTFREAYHPHYRVLSADYANFFPALLCVWRLTQREGRAVVAIDGRCGSGKTGLAALLERLFPCNLLHMDDFYLPASARASNWMQRPGGNIDFTRFLTQALSPARRGEAFTYRKFDCKAQRLGPPVEMPARSLTVVEGSYCLHPCLLPEYDLKIFLTCSKEEQADRLREREGEHLEHFERLWIPLEEQYLARCDVPHHSDLALDTGEFFKML